ncbi:MAG: winged helix-turn-helix domain-containing protein [Chloroflexi bacterium]|nr:winged helix-turn-helix domain-containing protein [Chloroflexota bacterium]
MITLSPTLARRLFIAQQRLAGPRPRPTADSLLSVTRDIGCLQLDPISAVARSHLLVLFSRVGAYDPALLDKLLFGDRALFEYWAHCASIVLTEDYPLFSPLMRRPDWSDHTRAWVKQNEKLKRYILNAIRKRGPLLSRDLEEDGIHPEAWVSTGWTSGRNISRMLDHLWIGGKIMVAGRDGIQKKWDLSERVLPDWTPRHTLSERERERQSVLRSLRALGVGTPRHINYHFTRGSYPTLKRTLDELEAERKIQRVEIRDDGETWPGAWYMISDAVPALERLSNGDWLPRATLLSPFDNLICDRNRTELMFDFFFRIEIYVPKAKRQWGYYVLPILHGDRLIGRVDPEMDRQRGVLTVNAVHAEPRAPAVGGDVRGAIESLAAFLGASEINYNKRRVPSVWKRSF